MGRKPGARRSHSGGCFLETRGPAHGCGRMPLRGTGKKALQRRTRTEFRALGVSRWMVTVTGGRWGVKPGPELTP